MSAKTIKETNAATTYLSLPRAAILVGITEGYMRRLFERGLTPPVQIVAGRRLIPLDMVPALKEAARKAGYLDEA